MIKLKLTDMPIEVINHIAFFLDHKSYHNFSLASHGIYELLNEPHCLYNHYRRYYVNISFQDLKKLYGDRFTKQKKINLSEFIHYATNEIEKKIVRFQGNIINSPYFFGSISLEEAKAILSENGKYRFKPDTFLIRYDEKQKLLYLCRLYDKSHYRFEKARKAKLNSCKKSDPSNEAKLALINQQLDSSTDLDFTANYKHKDYVNIGSIPNEAAFKKRNLNLEENQDLLNTGDRSKTFMIQWPIQLRNEFPLRSSLVICNSTGKRINKLEHAWADLHGLKKSKTTHDTEAAASSPS